MRYSVVTPTRDERTNIARLARALESQSTPPSEWVIVDTGSTDGTLETIDDLAERYDWVTVIRAGTGGSPDRFRVMIDAVHRGFAAVDPDQADVIVKIDADLAFYPDFFEALLAAFESEPRLAIAGGSCFEVVDGQWVERTMTRRTHVWGASRAYRSTCISDVFPLEERGYEIADELRAQDAGWTTRTLDMPFFHFRPEGQRDGSRARAWAAEGEVAYFLGYRPSYLFVRFVNRIRGDRAAVSIFRGYLQSWLRRRPRCSDARVRTLVRRRQRLRNLPRDMREARSLAARGRSLPLTEWSLESERTHATPHVP